MRLITDQPGRLAGIQLHQGIRRHPGPSWRKPSSSRHPGAGRGFYGQAADRPRLGQWLGPKQGGCCSPRGVLIDWLGQRDGNPNSSMTPRSSEQNDRGAPASQLNADATDVIDEWRVISNATRLASDEVILDQSSLWIAAVVGCHWQCGKPQTGQNGQNGLSDGAGRRCQAKFRARSVCVGLPEPRAQINFLL